MDICEGLKIDKTENFVCSWGNMIETGFMTPEEEVRFQYLKPDTEFEMMEILAVIMHRAWNCHLIKMRIRI